MKIERVDEIIITRVQNCNINLKYHYNYIYIDIDCIGL